MSSALLIMTSNFHPIIVRDDIINNITTDLPVAMNKTGQTVVYKTENANAPSTSNIAFSVVPTDHVVMDRNVKIGAKVELEIKIAAGRTVDDVVFKYGSTEALSAFPLNSLILLNNTTINGEATQVYTQDMMGMLSRMYEQEDFDDYNCPTMLDTRFKSYSNMALSYSNPLGNFIDSTGTHVPRGSFPLDSFTVTRAGTTPLVATSAGSTDAQITTACTCTNIDQSWTINLVFTTIEPLLFASPLIYSKSKNNAGIYGVHKLEVNLTMDTQARRVLCSSSGIPMTVAFKNVSECKLYMKYVKPHVSDLISPKNVLPYIGYVKDNYSCTDNTAGNNKIMQTTSKRYSSIPQKIFIGIRKLMSQSSCKDSDSFLPITKCEIWFGSNPNVLGSASRHDLYTMSKKNGSKQSIQEFMGSASLVNGKTANTIGSVLVLDPADFQLDDMTAPGCIGGIEFHTTLYYNNPDGDACEVVVICQHDGVFITESGVSSKQVALFTNRLVSETTAQQFGESADYIKQFSDGASLMSVPLLHESSSGSGVKSGGSRISNFSQDAMARINGH